LLRLYGSPGPQLDLGGGVPGVGGRERERKGWEGREGKKKGWERHFAVEATISHRVLGHKNLPDPLGVGKAKIKVACGTVRMTGFQCVH